MTLNIIGLGLGNQKDITLAGLEAIKSCDLVYLENYTSILSCTIEDLEKLYGKKIILATRSAVEQDNNEILENSKTKNVALLVIGDPLSATTHTDLILRAKELKIETNIIHNSSILTAIGVTGLQLYKFGKTTSIPLNNENVEAPYKVLKLNQDNNLHTLFILDLDIENNKFLTINKAIEYLFNIENKSKLNLIKENTKAIACARIGSKDQLIKYNTLKELKDIDFGKSPFCLIIPSELHFMEEDFLKLYGM
tara:strand:- start:21641 stop:22396 length:756 start_codon:yes stop_codon:yes gene_type:complete